MRNKLILIAAAMMVATVACSGDDTPDAGASATGSAQSSSTSSRSPLDERYFLRGAAAIDIDRLVAMAPQTWQVAYAAAEFDPSLGAMVVSDLQFTKEGGGLVTIDRAELYGVDLDAADAVGAGDAGAINAPFLTIFDKVRLFGISPTDRNGEVMDIHIAAAEFDELRMRPGALKQAEEGAAHVFNAFALDGVYMKGLAGKTPDDASDTALQRSFLAPDVRFVGIKEGRLDAFVVNGFSFDMRAPDASDAAMRAALDGPLNVLMESPLGYILSPDEQRISVQSFAWRGVDFSNLMEYALKDEEPPVSSRNLINFGAFEINDYELFVNGKRAQRSPKTTLSIGETTWFIPRRIELRSMNDQFDYSAYIPETEEELLSVFRDYKLDNVRSQSTLDLDWDPKKGGVTGAAAFSSEGLGGQTMKIEFSGFDLDAIEQVRRTEGGDAIGALNAFQISLVDETFLDAVFAIAGLQMNAAGDDLRQSAPAMIRLAGAVQAELVDPRIVGYVDALAHFVGKGGTLTIEAAPQKPVALSDLENAADQAPQNLPDILNLTVTRKP